MFRDGIRYNFETGALEIRTERARSGETACTNIENVARDLQPLQTNKPDEDGIPADDRATGQAVDIPETEKPWQEIKTILV